MRRREFLAAALGAAIARPPARPLEVPEVFKISLAQWSLHRMLRAGRLSALEFPAAARQRFGLAAVEYVNTFFKEKASDAAFLDELGRRAGDAGVRSLLIMVDGEGALGDPDGAERARTVQRHHKWADAAARLGCHSIRVNAASRGAPDRQRDLVADGLHRLAEYADGRGINVLVENHGGLSSNGAWLAGVIRRADHPRVGTLPDFGNFDLGDGTTYDRYRGVAELMPFARAVSAKSHDFDEQGRETHTDYRRMLRIVLDAGYRGWIGIEYEGDRLPEPEGVLATRRLLERVRSELAPAYVPAAGGRPGPPSPPNG